MALVTDGVIASSFQLLALCFIQEGQLIFTAIIRGGNKETISRRKRSMTFLRLASESKSKTECFFFLEKFDKFYGC